MVAAIKNLFLEQGADFAYSYVSNVNLTGYTLRGNIRQSTESVFVIPFTCTITNATTGAFTIAVPNNYSRIIEGGTYIYDIEAYTVNDASVKRLLQGNVIVSGEATEY